MRALTLLAVFAFLVSCASIQVSSDFDSSADFSSLKTWGWSPAAPKIFGDDPRLSNELIHARVKRAVDEALMQKRFKRVDSGADFLVHYALSIQEKIRANTIYDDSPSYLGHGRIAIPAPPQTYVTEYDEGTFLLDVLTPEGSVIWRGTAQGALDEREISQEERAARARATAVRVLESFPPKQDG